MRINQIIHSNWFQALVNSLSFLFMVACFILTILLPLPYHQEKPGGISLQPDPALAPPIIALCVVVPFSWGIIFLLLYKLTYKKSKHEVLNEMRENVEFDFISNEKKHTWEIDIENHIFDKKIRKAELEIKKKQQYIELKQRQDDMDKKIALLEKGALNDKETKAETDIHS